MKHFSPRTNRLERCTAKPGSCRFSVHGSEVPDVELLRAAADEAAAAGDSNTFLEVRRQIDVLTGKPPVFDAELPAYDSQHDENFFGELRARYETVAKGGVEFHLTPEGNEFSFYCLRCYGPVKDVSEGEEFRAVCQECGAEQDTSDECGTLLRRNELLFFNDEETKRASWYHSTSSPDWGDAVEAGLITQLHAGSLTAAEDRAEHMEINEGTSRKGAWVYELRLKPSATLDPIVHEEDPSEGTRKYREGVYSVNRYMNLYEDPGSVSLLITGDQVEVVRKYQLVER